MNEVPSYPVTIKGEMAPELGRWRWLSKWFLAIPHYVVLLFLWIAALFLTIIAFFAILFTGKYPRGIFDQPRGAQMDVAGRLLQLQRAGY